MKKKKKGWMKINRVMKKKKKGEKERERFGIYVVVVLHTARSDRERRIERRKAETNQTYFIFGVCVQLCSNLLKLFFSFHFFSISSHQNYINNYFY